MATILTGYADFTVVGAADTTKMYTGDATDATAEGTTLGDIITQWAADNPGEQIATITKGTDGKTVITP